MRNGVTRNTLTFMGAANIVAAGMTVAVFADDWPQWRGADRLAVWHETGIVEDLPDELLVTRFTPSGYVELDRTRLIEPTAGSGSRPPHGRIAERIVNWSHPAYANGHIVHRNDRQIIRASLRAADYE